MKFKIGDKVKIIKGACKGQTGFVQRQRFVDIEECYTVSPSMTDTYYNWCIQENEMELVSKVQFKIGDKVKSTCKALWNGKIAHIVDVRPQSSGVDCVYDLQFDDCIAGFYAKHFELVKITKFEVGDKIELDDHPDNGFDEPFGFVIDVKWGKHDDRIEVVTLGTRAFIDSDILEEFAMKVESVARTQFKVGDKIKMIGKGPNVGKIGWIIDEQSDFLGTNCYMISTSIEGLGGWYSAADELELMLPSLHITLNNGSTIEIPEPEFEFNDRVRIRNGRFKDQRGRIYKIKSEDEEAQVELDTGCIRYWPLKDLELVTIRGEGSKNIAWGSDIHGHKPNKVILDEIQQIECKMCGGTGKLLMLNNYVPCDCTLSGTEE